MKKALPIIVILLIVLGIAGLVFYQYQDSKVQMNTGYVNGNTAGNLYNAGLFCENNGTVFFSNPDDNGKLYSMDADGSNLTKLCNDTAMYINADSNYVYYVRDNTATFQSSTNGGPSFPYFSYNNNSLCRIDRAGGKCTILDEDPCIYASLIGNYIYYLHYDNETATTLYKIKIDGTEKTKLSDTYVFTCSTDGQYFFYNGMQYDGYIYRYDTATDSSVMIYPHNTYKPTVTADGNAYYLDVDRNNALVHVDIASDNPVTLTNDSVDLYNVYGSTIFYQNYDKDGSKLCCVQNDGSNYKVLAQGNYSNINVTSYYTYFTDFRTGNILYTSTSNPDALYAFHPGIIEDK